MAIICENIITSGLKVKETILHVFNWNHDGKNVDKITLVFDNNESIVYATELKLDLPNGDYHYINDEYILIEGTDVVEEIEKEMIFPDFRKLDSAIGYIDYLIEQAANISEEIKNKAINLKKELEKSPDNIDDILKKVGLLASELNKIIDNIPEKVKQGQKYLIYLEGMFNKIVKETFSKIKEETIDDFIKCSENLGGALEDLYKYAKE
jgi:hypothetical protein